MESGSIKPGGSAPPSNLSKEVQPGQTLSIVVGSLLNLGFWATSDYDMVRRR